MNTDDPYYDVEETLSILRIDRSTLTRKMQSGAIPYNKRMGKPRFLKTIIHDIDDGVDVKRGE